jgi:hypothetical protein
MQWHDASRKLNVAEAFEISGTPADRPRMSWRTILMSAASGQMTPG